MAAVEKSAFTSDPSFCPFCGLILPLPGLNKTVMCRLCGYNQDAEGMWLYYCLSCQPDRWAISFTSFLHFQFMKITLSTQ